MVDPSDDERRPLPDVVAAIHKQGFDLREWVGGGAYGNVYRAEQRSLGRSVAIKFFDKAISDAANRKRFRREAPLLARVQHRSVPYVLKAGEITTTSGGIIPYSVMQFVDGRRLDTLMPTGQPDLRLVLRVMQDILAALRAAHGLHVVHRDVKPDNIIVCEDNTYLIDFSIGICLVPETGLTRATTLGMKVGTIDYAAPEQMVDASSVDLRADVYSAGAVLAEMLGARPRLKTERIDHELGHVGSALRAIVKRATAERREARYSTAAEFLADLNSVLGHSSIDVSEPRLVFCKNPTCTGAKLSSGNGNYYWGPRIEGPTQDRFCDACGSEYVRDCPKCHRELPADLAKLIVKTSKAEHKEPRQAYCSKCGTFIFRTPACSKCGSFLAGADLGADTASAGCERCRKTGYTRGSATEPEPLADEDIPF